MIDKVGVSALNLRLLFNSKSSEGFCGSFGLDSSLRSCLHGCLNLSLYLGLCFNLGAYLYKACRWRSMRLFDLD